MTTQYTPTLKLALPVTGELSGTWGDTVNDNITSMIEQAIAGLSTINTWTANAHTLTTANGTTSESRCAMLVAATGGGAPTAAADIICPAAAKLYVLQNNTSFAVTLKTSAGTGVAVAAGDTAFLFCDATNVNSCVTTIVNGNITGNLTVGGNATINGNTTLGNATSDTITATARFNTDLVPSTDNARDLGSAANSWKDLFIDGTATMALVAISGGTINGVSIGATTAATLINVDNLRLDGNTLSSTDTNGNVVIAPNGTGDVQLDADTVRVGDAAAAATLTSNGAGALTVTTGGAADLTLSTNSGTTSGTVVIANGANGNITLTPDGTGDVILSADRVQMGDSNTDTTLTTNGTGSLNLTTNNGTNSGTIQLAQGVNGNITLTPNGTGSVSVPKLVWSNGTTTRVPYLTTGGQFTDSANLTFSGTSLSTTQIDITAQGTLRLQDTTGGEYVALRAPATLAANYTLTFPADDGTSGQALITDGSGVLSWSTAASGDVYGPASSTDDALARFDSTTGKLIQNSVGILSDAGILTGLTGLTSSGSITFSSLTSGRVPYATTAGLLTDSANLTFNGTTLTANTIGAFTLGGTIAGGGNQINNVIIGTSTPLAGSFTTLTASTSITNSSLTSGRVTYAGTGGLLQDSANFTFNGTTVTMANDASISGLTVGKGAGAVAGNTAVGASALASNTTGSGITALGNQAGNANLSGVNNVFVGSQAGKNNQTGNNNVVIGVQAFEINTNQSDAIFIGSVAGYNCTAGSNMGIGVSALRNATGGTNIAIGNSAMINSTAVSGNVAVGYEAMKTNITGVNQTAVGYQALYTANNASNNGGTAVGYQALYNSTGANNVAVGQAAGKSVSTGDNGTYVGWLAGAGSAAITGNGNVAMGSAAGYQLTSGGSNTLIGTSAGTLINSGANNVAVGGAALANATTANNNTAVGYGAIGAATVTGNNNAAVGYQALYNLTSGVTNVAIGGSALQSVNTGVGNIGIGNNANQATQGGTANIGIGSGLPAVLNAALSNQTTGSYNIGIGSGALGQGSAAFSSCTAVGHSALTVNTGSTNTAIGVNSGSAITSGAKNTILGSFSGNLYGLDIRTANNYIVLSDGDGNPTMSLTDTRGRQWLGYGFNSVSEGDGTFNWANVSSAAIDLLTLFPSMTATTGGISVYLQVVTQSAANTTSVIIHGCKTNSGGWNFSQISTVGGSITVTATGSSSTITLTFGTGNQFGKCFVKAITQG